MILPDATRELIRATRQAQHLGENPRCRYCRESNPDRLMRVKGNQGGHHKTFRERDPEGNDVVCGSCQLEIHRRLATEYIGPKRELDVSGLTASRLRSMAVSYRMEADYRIRDAQLLEKWADELQEEEQ